MYRNREKQQRERIDASQLQDKAPSLAKRRDPLHQLHHSIGNQAVTRLFQAGAIQAKLTIGAPNDRYEQEADRVADQVMRMPESEVTGILRGSSKIQRKCAACASGQGLCPKCAGQEEGLQRKPLASTITPLIQLQSGELEEDEKESLQAKEAAGRTPEVTPEVQADINALRGGGQPLSESVRAFFEPRFGHGFSQVRVHTDSQAADTVQKVNARAFTIGRDIMFGAGQYSSETSVGKQLLAHELTHIVQQRAGKGGPRQLRGLQTTPTLRAVQRFSFSDCHKTACNATECGDIEKDLRVARDYVDVAITTMSKKHLSSQTRTAMRWLFLFEDDSANAYILKILRTMKTALIRNYNDTDITCAQDCGVSTVAFVESSTPMKPGDLLKEPIGICPIYFTLIDRERAIALVHEAGHLAGLSGDVYKTDSKFRLLQQADALGNAEHFALLVQALNGILKPDLRTSIGAAGGFSFAGGERGWFLTGFFDVTLNRPVLRIYNPVFRFSLTGYGVPGSGPDQALEEPNDKAIVASLLAGVRFQQSRGPGGFFGDILLGGGWALRGADTKFVFNANSSLGYRWQRTEFALGASYIRDTTAAEDFQNVFQIGLSVNFNFFDLIGK